MLIIIFLTVFEGASLARAKMSFSWFLLTGFLPVSLVLDLPLADIFSSFCFDLICFPISMTFFFPSAFLERDRLFLSTLDYLSDR